MPPTLQVKGNLEAHEYSESQSVLDEILPVDYIMARLELTLGKAGTSPLDRIIICKSSTGSGKSTVLPPEYYHRYFKNDPRGIACTQPRVFNAKDVPNGLLKYHTAEFLTKIGKKDRTPLKMGKNIGYQTGSFIHKPTAGITFMTIGVLAGQLNSMSDEDFMRKYSIIFVDEAHERSGPLDGVLFSLKQFVERNYRNPKCPFVFIMSATFDTRLYADYMLSSIKSPADRYGNIIIVRGTTFPIDSQFLEYDATDYIEGTLTVLKKLHSEYDADFLGDRATVDEEGRPKALKEHNTIFRDVAIFVPGKADGKKLIEGIEEMNKTLAMFRKYPMIPLYIDSTAVQTENDDYVGITKPYEKMPVDIGNGETAIPVRRVIIATASMETGITIETLRHVIEMGYSNNSLYNSAHGYGALCFQPVNRATSTQRCGRVGRIYNGVSWRIYTKDTFDKLDEDPLPDVVREQVDSTLLSILCKLSDPENKANELTMQELLADREILDMYENAKIDLYNMDMFTLPPPDSMQAALEKLYILGAITPNCTVTPVGIILNKFSIPTIESIKMLISGYAWKASISDMVTMCAVANIETSDLFPKRARRFMSAVKKGLVSNYREIEHLVQDDMIKCLIVFDAFTEKVSKGASEKKMRAWCGDRGIEFKTIMDIVALRDDLFVGLAQLGFDPLANPLAKLSHQRSTNEILDCIKRIKKCIYEGYKMNLATKKLDAGRGVYTTIKGDNVFRASVPEGVKNIVVSALHGKLSPDTNLYEFKPIHTCVMDGYVVIDQQFDTLV